MRLSLFSRLTLGYLTIFLLVTAVSAYAIYQLRYVAARANSVLMVDNQVLDYAEKLRESLLSQSRYEQRFMLSKDEAEYRLFVREKEDFDLQLTNALALGESRIGGILSEIQQHYQNYQELIADEVQLLRAKKVYPQNEYKQNKDTIVSGIVDSLDTLKEDQRQAMNVKVRELAEEADQARRVSFFITSSCLIAIVLLSLLITRSITRPVALLKSKTRDIAEGRFDAGLRISSPPEIAELAVAFNRMCERLGELERMKADFFSSMSHELRTPLTSIKEGTGLLLDGVGGETTNKQRRLLTILAEESNRLIGVVNSLLDLSKLEAGMLNYEFETVNLDPLIRRAVAEIAPLVEAKQITVETAIEVPLPPARLDPERMLQVLRNLLGNAVKFTPKGGQVTVTASPGDGKLQVSVQDSGPGIPAESLTAIFEKFHQGNDKGAHTRPGTGLGLAIAKNIINSHGGEIWAESQLGQGSKFCFVLPCSA
ncbi:MAG TPA: HAMP domain-containing sensor histidine kinase [Candidatus Binatia bacterium]|nr:HAMP domain-containing sensor histidine kinase [Candidatus Binatia bacterium]